MEKDLEHTIAGRIRETEDGSLHWIVRSMHSEKKYKKNSKTIIIVCTLVWIVLSLILILSRRFDPPALILPIIGLGMILIGLPALILGVAHTFDRSFDSYEMNRIGIRRTESNNKEVSLPYDEIDQVILESDSHTMEIRGRNNRYRLLFAIEDYDFAEEYLLDHIRDDTPVTYKS